MFKHKYFWLSLLTKFVDELFELCPTESVWHCLGSDLRVFHLEKNIVPDQHP